MLVGIPENVIISIISGIAGVLAAYITVRYKQKKERPKAEDRIDTAFEAYEKIIRELQADNDSLRKRIRELDK